MSAQNYFSHTSKDGRKLADRINDAGYLWRRAAENIAQGYRTPAAVVQGWMNSSGHRANMLNCELSEVGIGYAPSGHYWVMNLGQPR